MADHRSYLVKHPEGYLRMDGKPIAFSKERALELAGSAEEVEVVPDDMVVVLDDSARKLPRSLGVSPHLHSIGVRSQ